MIALDVSRETQDCLESYVRFLERWNRRINLVAAKSLSNVWERHIEDSAQVFQSMRGKQTEWLDLGSGGGLPGIVVAILGKSDGINVTMIESDKRKSTFLRQVSRHLGLATTVISDRIESVPKQNSAVVSARALANLDHLLGYVDQHGASDAQGIFPKGKTWESEVQIARQQWHFECEAIPSRTDSEARILRITGVERV